MLNERIDEIDRHMAEVNRILDESRRETSAAKLSAKQRAAEDLTVRAVIETSRENVFRFYTLTENSIDIRRRENRQSATATVTSNRPIVYDDKNIDKGKQSLIRDIMISVNINEKRFITLNCVNMNNKMNVLSSYHPIW